jgi:hypothetical protein
MRPVLNIKIIFLGVEPSNSITEWKNLWETANNVPCGITDDGLYYVIVDFGVLSKIANLAGYEDHIFPVIKDFCIRNSFSITDCPKMEIYCDDHGRFYADIDKEKPLVLFSIGLYNSHESYLDLDREIMKSLQSYAYADFFVVNRKEYVTQFEMLLFHSVNNVLVNDVLYKIFSLKISEFNTIKNLSLSIERFSISNNRIGYSTKDEENLKHVLTFYPPNLNI